MVHAALRSWRSLRRADVHGLKNAEVPAPVLVGHQMVTLGLALRDLRLRHDITPWHTFIIGQADPNFNPHHTDNNHPARTIKPMCGKT